MANDQTRTGMLGSGHAMENAISDHDRQILRPLAGRVAELATRKIESEKRDLWYRHNALEPTRPLIFCDPEHGWTEIITEDMLACRSKLARDWEMRLRKQIFWAEGLKDDRVIEPFFNVGHVYEESDWGMQYERIGGQNGGSYVWDAPLKNYEDLEKLHFPRIEVDEPATQERVALAQSVLGDLLTVRLRTGWWWTLGLTWAAIKLRGLEQLMLDMYDHPDELKRLMAFLRDGHLAKLDFLESHGLLAPNTGGDYVGSGGFGYTTEIGAKDGSTELAEVRPSPPANDQPRLFAGGAGPSSARYSGHTTDFPPPKTKNDPPPPGVRTRDMWGFCESQETVGVSPEMFDEFVFTYQLPLLQRFGLNCYGCCEPLHLRWDVVQRTPHLRRVSVSPWADVAKMAEQLGDRFVFSYKPPPSDLAMPQMNEDRVRSLLKQVRKLTRGCRLEVIMKDNHTLGGSPRNAVRWVEIARECLS